MKLSKKFLFIFFITLFSLNIYTNEFANKNNYAAGLKTGTLGIITFEGALDLTPSINTRILYNNYTYDYNTTESDIEYNIDFDIKSIAFLFDFYPFKKSFHGTIGFFKNDNALNLNAKIKTNEKIGDTTYTKEEIGVIHARADFDSISGYLGIGWGNPFIKKRFRFSLDLGLIFQGSPDIDLTSSNGSLSNDQAFNEDLKKEEKEIEDDFTDFKFWPVITFGFTYRF